MKRVISLMLALICVVSLAACSNAANEKYNLGNSDRADYFLNAYNRLIADCGKGEYSSDGALTGVSVVRVLEFSGDENLELYMAYRTAAGEYKQIVYGFDNGAATLLDEVITTKSAADNKAPCVWLYTDSNNRSYIVTGDDLSQKADYFTYTKDADKYGFASGMTQNGGAELDGTYEKIELAGLAKGDADKVLAETNTVLDAIKSQITD